MLKEQVAEKEHEQWLRWAGTVIKDLWVISSGHKVDCECVSCKRIRRWKPNMIPYSELPDNVKEYDRIEATPVLNLFKAEIDKLTVIDDEEIIKLTSHWNPIPNRLEGITPETIKLTLFQSVGQTQLQHTKKQLLEGLK